MPSATGMPLPAAACAAADPSRWAPVAACHTLLPSDLNSTRTRHHTVPAATGTRRPSTDDGFGWSLPPLLSMYTPYTGESTTCPSCFVPRIPAKLDNLAAPTTVEIPPLSPRPSSTPATSLRAHALVQLTPAPSPSRRRLQHDLCLPRWGRFRARRTPRLSLAQALCRYQPRRPNCHRSPNIPSEACPDASGPHPFDDSLSPTSLLLDSRNFPDGACPDIARSSISIGSTSFSPEMLVGLGFRESVEHFHIPRLFGQRSEPWNNATARFLTIGSRSLIPPAILTYVLHANDLTRAALT